jgi:hypothetical protein
MYIRKRKHTRPAGSLDLLLDTVSNALGGIIFLALLMALLSSRLPIKDAPEIGKRVADPTAIAELEATLARMPPIADLDSWKQQLVDGVAAYRHLAPTPTTATIETLTAERAHWVSVPHPDTPPTKVFRVAEVKADSSRWPFAIVIKNNSIYMGEPLTAMHTRKLMQSESLTLRGIRFDRDPSFPGIAFNLRPIAPVPEQFVLAALQQLPPDSTRLLFIVYPDSVATFHKLRSKALPIVQHAYWQATPEGTDSKLILARQTQTNF